MVISNHTQVPSQPVSEMTMKALKDELIVLNSMVIDLDKVQVEQYQQLISKIVADRVLAILTQIQILLHPMVSLCPQCDKACNGTLHSSHNRAYNFSCQHCAHVWTETIPEEVSHG